MSGYVIVGTNPEYEAEVERHKADPVVRAMVGLVPESDDLSGAGTGGAEGHLDPELVFLVGMDYALTLASEGREPDPDDSPAAVTDAVLRLASERVAA